MSDFELIKQALEKTLKVPFEIVETTESYTDDQEKKLFIKLINRLEKLITEEETILKDYKIDLSSIVEPYWEMVEECLNFSFATEVQDLIWWYLNERKTVTGEIQTWVDDEGIEYTFKNPGDLYEYILMKFNF